MDNFWPTKSISIKNYLLPFYIKLKDVTLKKEAQIKYKQYRNLVPTLMKESKSLILQIISKTTLNDLKSTHEKV